MLDAVAAALAGLRGVKSTAKVSMRTELTAARCPRPRGCSTLAARAAADLAAAGKIVGDLAFIETDGADALAVSAELVPPAPTEWSRRPAGRPSAAARPVTAT